MLVKPLERFPNKCTKCINFILNHIMPESVVTIVVRKTFNVKIICMTHSLHNLNTRTLFHYKILHLKFIWIIDTCSRLTQWKELHLTRNLKSLLRKIHRVSLCCIYCNFNERLKAIITLLYLWRLSPVTFLLRTSWCSNI